MGLFNGLVKLFTVGKCYACNEEKEYDKMNHYVTDLMAMIEHAEGKMLLNERYPELLKLKNVICPEGSHICNDCWQKYKTEVNLLRDQFNSFRNNGIPMNVETIGLVATGELDETLINVIKDNVIEYALERIRYYNFDHYKEFDIVKEVLDRLIGDELIEQGFDLEEFLDLYDELEDDILTNHMFNPYYHDDFDIYDLIEFANNIKVINKLANRVKVKKGIEEFKKRYDNVIIKKNSVNLYNVNYGKDFSHLGGYVFTIPCVSCKSVRAYDRVKFYAALWGYDIAYNVYYNGKTVTGVMAKRRK